MHQNLSNSANFWEKRTGNQESKPYQNKSEVAAIKWINLAFDLDRVEPTALGLTRNNSMGSHADAQVHRFNNSLAQMSKGTLSSLNSRKNAQEPHRFLFGLIRFDFLKPQEADQDLNLWLESLARLGSKEGSIENSARKESSLRSRDTSNSKMKSIDSLKIGNIDLTRTERKGVGSDRPEGSSASLGQYPIKEPTQGLENREDEDGNWDKYKVNGGFVRIDVVEKVVLMFEEMKHIPPKITGRMTLEEKGMASSQQYLIKWPDVPHQDLKIKNSPFLQSTSKKISKITSSFSGRSEGSQAQTKNDLLMYRWESHMLRKEITPFIVESRFSDSSFSGLRLRLLLNPKYSQHFLTLELKLLTEYPPLGKKSSSTFQLLEEGFQTELVSNDFQSDLSWHTKLELNSGNRFLGVWLVAKFNRVLFPQTLPALRIRIQDPEDDFNDGSENPVAVDQRMIFEFKKKF